MDFAEGFQWWRPLGLDAQGNSISFQAITAIHVAHRLAAVVTATVLLVLASRLHRTPRLRTAARWLAALVLLQIATGLSNVVLGWPLVAAVAHTGGAAAMLGVLVWVMASTSAALPVPTRVQAAIAPAVKRSN
jgi:cytochrome c oxidase assembly protein subunit 15